MLVAVAESKNELANSKLMPVTQGFDDCGVYAINEAVDSLVWAVKAVAVEDLLKRAALSGGLPPGRLTLAIKSFAIDAS